MFRIKKVLNVNVVLAEQDGHEYIAFGKGIGYRQKVNACLPDNAIFKKFMPLDDSRKSEMIQSLNNIPPVYISITSQIVTYAEQQLQLSLLPSIYYPLTDHLAFSVQRYHSKQSLGNRIYWEMKTYYPEMFAIGEYGLTVVEATLQLALPREEAANIAFHIINATPAAAGKANILEVTQLVDNVLQAVRALTGGTIDTTSLNYERFVTHMKFFAERYLGDTMLADDGQLLTSVYTVYPEAAKIALKVQKTIIAIYEKEPTKEELAYLIIHIHRVLTN